MGKCVSREGANDGEIYNKNKRHDRTFRAGVKFKDMELSGIMGYSSVVNNVYTASKVRLPTIPEEVEVEVEPTEIRESAAIERSESE